MTPNEVVDFYVTQAAAGEAAEVTQPAVARWVAVGRVPHLAQLKLQAASGGKLKADKGILPLAACSPRHTSRN